MFNNNFYILFVLANLSNFVDKEWLLHFLILFFFLNLCIVRVFYTKNCAKSYYQKLVNKNFDFFFTLDDFLDFEDKKSISYVLTIFFLKIVPKFTARNCSIHIFYILSIFFFTLDNILLNANFLDFDDKNELKNKFSLFFGILVPIVQKFTIENCSITILMLTNFL